MNQGSYKTNSMKDGKMPCCSKCGKPFPDSEIGDAKNYPEDGLIAVFFTCAKCNIESSFYYVPFEEK